MKIQMDPPKDGFSAEEIRRDDAGMEDVRTRWALLHVSSRLSSEAVASITRTAFLEPVVHLGPTAWASATAPFHSENDMTIETEILTRLKNDGGHDVEVAASLMDGDWARRICRSHGLSCIYSLPKGQFIFTLSSTEWERKLDHHVVIANDAAYSAPD